METHEVTPIALCFYCTVLVWPCHTQKRHSAFDVLLIKDEFQVGYLRRRIKRVKRRAQLRLYNGLSSCKQEAIDRVSKPGIDCIVGRTPDWKPAVCPTNDANYHGTSNGTIPHDWACALPQTQAWQNKRGPHIALVYTALDHLPHTRPARWPKPQIKRCIHSRYAQDVYKSLGATKLA